ncbi:CynX/NimT family MFS transporter [Pseudonocardia sp. H11422]|uniref:MFS transporter n=1 Tax=Pseudonocardia sp. H11422 TaxID=2835866 RepID=UPI00292E0F9D|nr:MFS transporter [Pseudonocardia sp. H11422]
MLRHVAGGEKDGAGDTWPRDDPVGAGPVGVARARRRLPVTGPRTRTRPRSGPAATALLVLGIVLLAINLRGPIVAVSPVLDAITTDLRIGAGTAGLLTSLPVLCFGLATPLAAWLLARAGLERGVLIALVALLAGIVVRSVDGIPAALAGTLVIGVAITVGNVAVPVVIGRDLSHRAGPVLGAYTAALNVGSMLTLSLTVPISAALGWRAALVTWGVLVVAAAVVWWAATRGRAGGDHTRVAGGAGPDADRHPVWWRRPIVWGLTAAFAGQAFAYYGVTAWLPLLLRDERGLSDSAAGFSSSIFQVAAIVGAFGVPALLRLWSPRPVLLVVCAAWSALPLGLLLAPQWWPLWCGLGGAAQGGGITVIFSMIVLRARSLAENRSMSALVQGGGYVVAATGPTVVGTVHEATGGWTAPLLVVLGSIALLTVAGSLSARRPPAAAGGGSSRSATSGSPR